MAAVETCPTCGGPIVAVTGATVSAASVPGVAEQAGSDRDRTAESRDRAAERRDRGADDRDVLARRHQQAASDRGQLASDQDQTSSDDDQTASGSDQLSADADQRAADEEFIAGGDAASYGRGVLARDKTRRERGSSSASRDETTAARELGYIAPAEHEDLLRLAGDDRAHAADDREESAHDRQAALRNRAESAAAAQRAVETLEAVSDGFFTLDLEGRFTYLNAQSETFLKRRREALIGKVVWEAFPEVAGSRFADEYRRALREQVPVRFEETYTPMGRTFEARAYPVTDGLAVYFTDVTGERASEERLRQGQRLAAIGRVTASVAHDFNNLLTAIGGFAGVGQSTVGDDATRICLDQIASASERAVALTRQLLVFSREQELSPTAIDLNVVVSDLVPVLRQLVPARIELDCALSSQPVPIFVDRTQLEQVLLNLVVNSRDAIETTGSITITTRTDEPPHLPRDAGAASGWLQVADTGTGIAEELLPLIFEPFFSTKPQQTGAGLGLATIYGIVSQSGGTIVVDSTLGVGTTMTVALPPDRAN